MNANERADLKPLFLTMYANHIRIVCHPGGVFEVRKHDKRIGELTTMTGAIELAEQALKEDAQS